MSTTDPFDDVFSLESRFYTTGYQSGLTDGQTAGTVEGRSFGLQKGYEKFFESGRLAGKTVVLANRLPNQADKLPPLPNNPRLEKNITTLYGLVDPRMVSVENSDEAVGEFDERLKKAQGRAKVVERAVAGGRE